MTATTAVVPGISAVGQRQGEKIDALDLEPVAYKLMHPELGAPVMTLTEADQHIAAYRCFLKLCAWYPYETIVPSQEADEAWHAHILDTAKYADDSEQAFGYFLHHFPYLGLRGPQDAARWQAASERTRELSRAHFGAGLVGGAGRRCHNGGSSCNQTASATDPALARAARRWTGPALVLPARHRERRPGAPGAPGTRHRPRRAPALAGAPGGAAAVPPLTTLCRARSRARPSSQDRPRAGNTTPRTPPASGSGPARPPSGLHAG